MLYVPPCSIQKVAEGLGISVANKLKGKSRTVTLNITRFERRIDCPFAIAICAVAIFKKSSTQFLIIQSDSPCFVTIVNSHGVNKYELFEYEIW